MKKDKRKAGNLFTRATLNAAMADSPAIMQASGWNYDKDGNLYQDPESESAKKLSKSLAVLGTGALGLTGAGLLSSAGLTVSGVGEALTRGAGYLQPSKYLEAIYHYFRPAARGLLKAAPYYSGASTLAGALSDAAVDSYFATKSLRGVGKQGSVTREIQNALGLTPYLGVGVNGARSAARNLGTFDALLDASGVNKGFGYAKDKYIKRGDLLFNKAEQAYRSGVGDYTVIVKGSDGLPRNVRYNSAELIEPVNQPAIKYAKFSFDKGHYDPWKNEIMINMFPAKVKAMRNPRGAHMDLNATAAHEGTHWAMHYLNDNISVPGNGYFVANKKHPLYADYTSWFDNQPRGFLHGDANWLASPEEFVAEMTKNQFLNNMPTNKAYWAMPVEQRYPIAKGLKQRWSYSTLGGVDDMAKELSKWGYTSGGILDRLQKHYGSNEKALEAIRKFRNGGEIHIKPSKKGTFTAAAKKHGKSVQAFASQVLANKENYSPAMVKKANVARNFGGHKHADGGLIERYGIDKVRAAMQKVKR